MPKTARSNHRDSERKVQRILRHAARVFSEKGYEGASIRDISRSSGISLAGLYYHCESKQKLLYLIQTYAFTSILRRLEERLSALTDPEERLRILIQNHLEYFLEHPVETKVLSHEDDMLEGSYRREVAGIKKRYYQIARSIFEELQKSGRVRPIDPRVAVLSLFGMMNWVYTWHKPRVDPDAASLAATMGAIFLAGVSREQQVAGGKSPSAARQTLGPALEVAG